MHTIHSQVYYYSTLLLGYGKNHDVIVICAISRAHEGDELRTLTAMKIQPFDTLDAGEKALSFQMPNSDSLEFQQLKLRSGTTSYVLSKLSLDELLVKRTRAVCEKNMLEFAELTTIQRKFLTHYRCPQCGLLPLYHVDLVHIKRVRCRQCGQLISFKRKGKYGKLRKEIALELEKDIQGSGGYVQ